MEKILWFRLETATWVTGKYLFVEQTQVLLVLSCTKWSLHLCQGIWQKQRDGREVLRSHPLVGELFAMADSQPGSKPCFTSLCGRLHRSGMDRNLARAEFFWRSQTWACVRDCLPGVWFHGVDDCSHRPQDVLPDRPYWRLATWLGRL